MSYQYLLPTPSLVIYLLAFAVIWQTVARRLVMSRLKKAETTLEFWRNIAVEAQETSQRYFDQLLAARIHRNGFESLLIHIWGAPALDRTPRDVCKVITELRDIAQRHSDTNEGLGRIIGLQDRYIKRLRGELETAVEMKDSFIEQVTTAEAESRKYQTMVAGLINRGWIIEDRSHGTKQLFAVANRGFQGTTIAEGESPEQAFSNALTKDPQQAEI